MPAPSVVPQASVGGTGSAEDRRAFQRFAADLEVRCRPLGAGRTDSWPARIKDISAGGVGLILERRFEPGTLLAIDLVNSASGSPRTLLSRVIHVNAHLEGEWLLGMSLLREMHEDELRNWGAEPTRPEGPDARTWVRVPCEIPGLCTDAGAEAVEPWQATVVNISPGGFGLITPRAVKEGSHLEVDLPGSDGEPARRLVRVVHAQEQPDGSWLLGCESTQKLSEEDQTAVRAGPRSARDHVFGRKRGNSTAAPASKPTAEKDRADPDLARLNAAWPTLPEHIRAAIRALLATAG